MVIKSPTYDGQTSFEMCKLQFEAANKADNWCEVEKAAVLMVALRRRALDLLRTMPAADKDDFGERNRQQLF